MEFCYRKGFSVPGINAGDAAAELDRIRQFHGELTPEVVIEESRSESAPLHPAFEWDNEKAAEEFRKQQARHLLRGICIVREESTPIPMHFHISTDEGGKYERYDDVANDPDLYEAALSELTGKVRGAQAAVDQLIDIGQKRLRGPKRKAAHAVKRHLEEASEALAGV